MVPMPRCLTTGRRHRGGWVVGLNVLAMLVLSAMGSEAEGQAHRPDVHYWHGGVMPPGAIGGRQLQRGGPLPGFFQPIEIRAPQGTRISLAEGGAFQSPEAAPLRAGMLIGSVYRLKVTNVPERPGMELFPTVEVINRLYTPQGQAVRFPVPIELTREDIDLALAGRFVTRVIYLEDPHNALPADQIAGRQSWFEAGPGSDPLAVADVMGRPMAILRLGGRLPDLQAGVDQQFLYGCPPVMRYGSPERMQTRRSPHGPSRTAAHVTSPRPPVRHPGQRQYPAASQARHGEGGVLR